MKRTASGNNKSHFGIRILGKCQIEIKSYQSYNVVIWSPKRNFRPVVYNHVSFFSFLSLFMNRSWLSNSNKRWTSRQQVIHYFSVLTWCCQFNSIAFSSLLHLFINYRKASREWKRKRNEKTRRERELNYLLSLCDIFTTFFASC